MITAELRRAILAAVGHDHDPLLRPGPAPGSYTSALPFRLAPEKRQALAERLKTEPWIATVEIDGYLTVTVTHDALATLAVRIARAGSDPPVGSLIAENDDQACSMVGRTYWSICCRLPRYRLTGGSMPNAPPPGAGKL